MARDVEPDLARKTAFARAWQRKLGSFGQTQASSLSCFQRWLSLRCCRAELEIIEISDENRFHFAKKQLKVVSCRD